MYCNRWSAFLAVGAALVMNACSGGDAKSCAGAIEKACACAGGGKGTQRCSAGGYGACLGCPDASLPPDLSPPPDCTKYPCGPYGTNVGNVIEDLAFVGQTDELMKGVIDPADPIKTIRLSDYFKTKKLRALVVLGAAGWCDPCMQEAGDLVALYKKYQADKTPVAFLEVIPENPAGEPADVAFLDEWAAKYKIPYDMATDPQRLLKSYNSVGPGAYPMQMVIRLKDMTIAYQHSATAGPDMEQKVAEIVAEP